MPQGQAGRPSKALTFVQAGAVLKAAAGTSMHAYTVVALLTGARTEAFGPARWGNQDSEISAGWTLALPTRCVEALWQHAKTRAGTGLPRVTTGRNTGWSPHRQPASLSTRPTSGVRFAGAQGGRRGGCRRLDPPRAPAQVRLSLLSDRGVPLEEISRLVGHSGTPVTEEVYRKQIRPVIQTGAVVMDGIFKGDHER